MVPWKQVLPTTKSHSSHSRSLEGASDFWESELERVGDSFGDAQIHQERSVGRTVWYVCTAKTTKRTAN